MPESEARQGNTVLPQLPAAGLTVKHSLAEIELRLRRGLRPADGAALQKRLITNEAAQLHLEGRLHQSTQLERGFRTLDFYKGLAI